MANDMSHFEPTIENLDGTNYQSWKRDIQMVLIKKGVWDYLGEVPQPGQETEWRRAQQLGLAEIHLACGPEQKQLIAEAIDMTEAWEILARRHEAPSVAKVMRLEQEFVSCKMSPIESVEKFITKVKSKAQELRAVGGDITAARTSNIILAGLPREYLPVTVMMARPGDLRLEDVIDAVLSQEATLKRLDSIKTMPVPHLSPATTAMSHQRAMSYPSCPNTNCTYHHNNQHPGGPARSSLGYSQHPGGPARSSPGYASQYRVSPYRKSGPSGETLRCYYCGKLGHTQNVCFNKYPHLKPEWIMQDEKLNTKLAY